MEWLANVLYVPAIILALGIAGWLACDGAGIVIRARRPGSAACPAQAPRGGVRAAIFGLALALAIAGIPLLS